MNVSEPDSFFLWELFRQLQRRKFPLGPEDFEDMRRALKLGFGLRSRRALRELCCSLWAKSVRDRDIINALFDQIPRDKLPAWTVADADDAPGNDISGCDFTGQDDETPGASGDLEAPVTRSFAGLPEIRIPVDFVTGYPFTFVHLYPLTYRETAQAWRRLREPVREGPPVEIDVDETVSERCRAGVAVPVVLIPRRRNTARLLVLADRNGSMTPYHPFVDEVSEAVRHSGSMKTADVYYCHNLPVEGADSGLLNAGGRDPFPDVDGVLKDIEPQMKGYVYEDAGLMAPVKFEEVLAAAYGASVAIISDAGAARNRMRNRRLIDTIAFLKGLRRFTRRTVWLNPADDARWPKTTAERIARHVPMFPLTARGVHRAVDVLKGRPFYLESPL